MANLNPIRLLIQNVNGDEYRLCFVDRGVDYKGEKYIKIGFPALSKHEMFYFEKGRVDTVSLTSGQIPVIPKDTRVGSEYTFHVDAMLSLFKAKKDGEDSHLMKRTFPEANANNFMKLLDFELFDLDLFEKYKREEGNDHVLLNTKFFGCGVRVSFLYCPKGNIVVDKIPIPHLEDTGFHQIEFDDMQLLIFEERHRWLLPNQKGMWIFKCNVPQEPIIELDPSLIPKGVEIKDPDSKVERITLPSGNQ